MTGYWGIPEIFPAPQGLETIPEMIERTSSFLSELEKMYVLCYNTHKIMKRSI